MSRRSMLATGAVASVGLWATPSILSLDRTAAAVGSCGIPPRRVDFSRFAGSNLPATFLSDDTTVTIDFSMSDPHGVQVTGYKGAVWAGSLNGLDNPVVTAMENARRGAYVDLIFHFSVAVCPTFSLVDVDRSPNNWEDTVRVIGRNGAATIDPLEMNVGGAQVQVDVRTVRGTASTNGPDGNVEVVFDQPITRLEIRHQDNSNWKDFQWIAVHDFFWC